MNEVLQKFISECEKIKSYEIEARRLYDHLLQFIDDKKDQQVLKGIILDEIRHEQIAQAIIKMLNS